MGVAVFLLITLRFLLVFTPQIGYIHPDEFFQTVEVVAGNILKTNVYTPWEFNSTMPLRSIPFPYVMSGLPFAALKYLQDNSYMNITAYWLLVLPRLWMTLLSLVSDLSVFFMCGIFDFDANFAMKLYASSYVALVYMTRTFSNSLESVFLSIFFIFLLKSTVIQTEKKKQKKSKENKGRYLNSLSSISWIFMGILMTTACFNRPTYLLFIEIPLILWYIIFVKPLPFATAVKYHVHMKVCSVIGVVTGFAVLVGVDTWYYNPVVFKNFVSECTMCINKDIFPMFGCLKDVASTLTVTPLNFLKYNSQSSNLASHGLHSRFLHLMVNVPLLLGPLVIPIYYTLVSMPISYIRGKFKTDLRVVYLSLVFISPVLLLSFFKHQEPRFLLPIVPLGCVLASGILGFKRGRKLLWTVWITFNIAATLFYGYLHQGGVIPSLMDTSDELAVTSKGGNSPIHYLLFYKTYMPPRHLLLSTNVEVIDLAGSPLVKMSETLAGLKKKSPKSSIQVLAPATVYDVLRPHLGKKHSLEMICPHISTEEPPDFLRIFKSLDKFDEHLSNLCINIINIKN